MSIGGAADPAVVARVWAWLPARADRRRVTQVAVIATELDLSTTAVAAALAWMEQRGHAIRDRATGRRSQSWHRGTPLLPIPDGAEESTLWP